MKLFLFRNKIFCLKIGLQIKKIFYEAFAKIHINYELSINLLYTMNFN